MKNAQHFESFFIPLLLISLMWLVFLFQYFGFITDCYGIIPWQKSGLKGILFAPFLHGSWSHLLGNTLTFTVVCFLTFQFYKSISYYVLILGWLFTGFFTWLVPSFNTEYGFYTSCHIGASGLVYMLGFFLFFGGIFSRELKLIVVSLIVVLFNGGMIWGILPQELFGPLKSGELISWQSHLGGAVVGTILAFIFRKKVRIETQKPSWEQANYNSEKDNELWETYKENNPEHFEEPPLATQEKDWKDLL